MKGEQEKTSSYQGVDPLSIRVVDSWVETFELRIIDEGLSGIPAEKILPCTRSLIQKLLGPNTNVRDVTDHIDWIVACLHDEGDIPHI